MTEQDLIEIIQEALEIEDTSRISLNDHFRDYDEWNSLGFLSFVTLIEEEYNIRVDAKVMRTFTTWKDVFCYLKSHA